MWFLQEYMESRKACSKSDIKIDLLLIYSKIRQELYYRAKRENIRIEKSFIIGITVSQPI